jgi:SAM-dependent methyltransferase
MAEGKLVGRYREVFGLRGDTALTEQGIRRHLELETALSHELRASAPAARWETFERCYDRLYSELPWLVGTGGAANPGLWSRLIGPPGSRVYEVGSGAGELAQGLAQAGYLVTATDVSRQRGDRVQRPNLIWATTDGVHLDRFAAPGSFDAVISNQVIEHLHPDDLDSHLRSALSLLAPGGRYAFATPHRLTGPHDVTQVLDLDAPHGMHLREYTNIELMRALRHAGFQRLRSVQYSPRLYPHPIPSRVHLWTMVALEAGLDRLTVSRARAVARRLRGPLRLDVFMVAERGG